MKHRINPPANRPGVSFKSRRSRFRGLQFAALVGVGITAAGGGVGLTSVIAAAPASAATNGPGYGDGSYNAPHQGAYVVNGVNTYCIQPGAAAPYGNTQDGGISGNVDNLSDTQLAQINSVVSKYGQTSDNSQAAAVAFVVKYLANPQGMIKDNGNPGSTFDSAIQWQKNTMGGQATTDQVQALADGYLQEAQQVTPGPTQPEQGTVSASLTVDPGNNFTGTLNLDDMTVSPATGTITLTNGVFADTGQSSMTGTFKKGDSFKVTGKPPVNTGTSGYKIAAEGTLTAANPSGYQSNVHVWTTSGQQTTVSAGERANGTTKQSFRASDPTARQVPQMSSTAQQLTSPYADTSDVVHVTGTSAAFPTGGVDVTNTAYWAPGKTTSAADQQYMDAAHQLSESTQTTSKAGDLTFTIDDLQNKPKDGTHVFWVATMKNHATGEVLQQAAYNAKGEQTPVEDFKVSTTPAKATVNPGDTTRDELTVNGYVPKNTTVVVTQYQVPAGQQLVCTPENQIGPSLNPVTIKPGMNKGAKYLTQWTGAQVTGNAGFVERTYVKGQLVHEAGCNDEPFTVTTPKTPPTPNTPPSTPPTSYTQYTPPTSTPVMPVVAG